MEDVGNAERSFERWRVFACFDSSNGLPRDADPLTKLGLRHLAMLEPKESDPI